MILRATRVYVLQLKTILNSLRVKGLLLKFSDYMKRRFNSKSNFGGNVNQPGIFLGCKIGKAILPRPFLTQTRYCSYRFCFAGSLAKGLNSLLDWPDVLFSKFSAKKALSCSSLSVLTSSGSCFISEKKGIF